MSGVMPCTWLPPRVRYLTLTTGSIKVKC